MKKTIFYSAAALLLSFAACDSKQNDGGASSEHEGMRTEANQSTDRNTSTLSREDHIKQVKADEVQTFNNIPEQARANISSLTDQYLQMKEALVASNAQQASAAASGMLQNLKGMDGNTLAADQQEFYKSRSESMRNHLQQVADEKDVVKQRDHFARLSKPMTELVSAFGSGKGTLYYQYCPMAFDNKGAYWLSNSKEIRNPFHPEEMMTCGRVAREL